MVAGVDGVLAARNAGQVKDRERLFQRVVAGVIAEGAFGAPLGRIDEAFQHVFAVGGDFQVVGFALHQVDRLVAQPTREEQLVDVGRQGRGSA